MHVLPNRNAHTRDAWRAVLIARVESRRAACCRCRECGFVAFRAFEHCPVCKQWNGPFDPVRNTSAPKHATHALPPVQRWSSRIARTLRNAAFRRPRASSAPLLSIVTLVLLVGGYVTVDRTCKADPVCRGAGTPAAVIGSDLLASNDPALPVLPAPVYPFHSTDGTQAAAARRDIANAGELAGRIAVAQAAPPMREPDRKHAGTVRVADWRGNHDPAHRTHAIRRVSVHASHARHTVPRNAEIAKLYRGH